MATIRDKMGHRCFEAGHDSVSRESAPIPRDFPRVIQSQGVAFALVGNRERTSPSARAWHRVTEGQNGLKRQVV